MPDLFGHLSTRESVLQDIRSLSSGTLATLTGYKEYSLLDTVQQEFAQWAENHTRTFENWMDAWTAYQNSKYVQAQKGRKPIQQALFVLEN